MLGQTSMVVDRSISKVKDHILKELNPQEVGPLVQNQTRTEEATLETAGVIIYNDSRWIQMNNPVQSVNQPDSYHLGKNNYRNAMCSFFFELIKTVKFVIQCDFKNFRIN